QRSRRGRLRSQHPRPIFVRTFKVRQAFAVLFLILLWLPLVFAQDARELDKEKVASAKLKGEHPLLPLMAALKSSLKPELGNVHPRVYVTESELEQLRVKARTTHRDLWQQALQNIRALQSDPPPPPAQKRREQNEVGLAIAEAAFAYKIE